MDLERGEMYKIYTIEFIWNHYDSIDDCYRYGIMIDDTDITIKRKPTVKEKEDRKKKMGDWFNYTK